MCKFCPIYNKTKYILKSKNYNYPLVASKIIFIYF